MRKGFLLMVIKEKKREHKYGRGKKKGGSGEFLRG